MKETTTCVASANPIRTREDMQNAVIGLCSPLAGRYSQGKAQLRLGVTGTSYSAKTAEFEGFSRVLWGLVPLIAGGGDSALWEDCLEGIRNGTNPSHEEYWGDPADYDQILVEMAAFGYALALAPEHVWAPLSDEEKYRLYNWLSRINDRKLYDCNWLLFQVVVNLGFRSSGMPYDKALMESNLDQIERFYLGNGWYSDGVPGHCDYYGPFAIHFYCLLYAKLMAEEDPNRSSLYKERAALFAGQFVYWFSGEGDALPYGRSLAYRFSQAAFWSALVYAGVEPLPTGVMKGIILRHLRWWLGQPIFHTDGTLSIGYRYPNLIMSENYNSPGSPYWAFKIFLPLALELEHPFWTEPELPLPPLERSFVQEEPRMILCRQEDRNHVLAFHAGSEHTNQHTHTSAKYEKFVYSNVFGFSVPRAEWGLAQAACDSMLALSECDNLYRVKRNVEEYRIQGNVIYMRWKPWHDVEVQTWLIVGAPWHVRVHRIASKRPLDLAEGGFALAIGDEGLMEEHADDEKLPKEHAELSRILRSDQGASGIVSLHGWDAAECIRPHANTNVMNPRTVIPTLTLSLQPGTAWLASAVYGEPGVDCMADWRRKPAVVRKADEWIIVAGGDDPVEIARIPVVASLKKK